MRNLYLEHYVLKLRHTKLHALKIMLEVAQQAQRLRGLGVRARVRDGIFLFIPNEYEHFLTGNYRVMSYSVLLKECRHPNLLADPKIRRRSCHSPRNSGRSWCGLIG